MNAAFLHAPQVRLTLLGLAACLVMSLSCRKDNPTDSPRRFVEAVNRARTFDELHDAIQNIRTKATVKDIGEIAKILLAQLVETTQLEIDTNQVSENSFRFESSNNGSFSNELVRKILDHVDEHGGNPESRKANLRISHTTHDIAYAGGRAAWTIEEVFGLLLPSIRSNYDDLRTASRIKVIQHDLMKDWGLRVNVARVLQLDEQRRIEVARNCDSPRIMRLLAKDPSVEVRKQVAASIWTPTYVRRRILKNIPYRRGDKVVERARSLNPFYVNGFGHPKLAAKMNAYYFQCRPYYNTGTWSQSWFLKHQLESATTYYQLYDAIESVRRYAPTKAIRPLAESLISSIPDSRPLQFDVHATDNLDLTRNSLKHQFRFLSSTIDNSMLYNRPVAPNDFSYSTQDIGYVGGRAAWALEQIFGLLLPAIQRNYSDEVIEHRQEAIRNTVFADWENRVRIARLRQLPVADRIEIALNHPNPRVLAALADDPSIRLRVLLCESRHTPSTIQTPLLMEIDADYITDLQLRQRFIEAAGNVEQSRSSGTHGLREYHSFVLQPTDSSKQSGPPNKVDDN